MKADSFISVSFPGKKRKAFTLVETVIAMGVVAFAMLGILGMVPVGLTNFREAMSTTAESQIVQGLSNDILLTDYSQLLTHFGTNNPPNYYNDEGRLVSSAEDPAAVFEVIVRLVDLSAPDVEATAGQTVRIEVRKMKSSQAGKKYSFIVPKG